MTATWRSDYGSDRSGHLRLNVPRLFGTRRRPCFLVGAHAMSVRQPPRRTTMSHQTYQECLDACNACQVTCLHCAVACLNEPSPAELADCIRLDLDCAELCQTAVGYMARGSSQAKAVCVLCATICQKCGAECAKHAHDHCQTCARACEECAQACRAMQPQFNWKEQMALIGHIRRHVLHHPRIAGSVRCHWKAASKAQCAHIARGIFIVVHAPRPSLVCLSPSA
jgi:hypothetical protein